MKKVLVVEDKMEAREVLVRLLKEIDEGTAVYTAENEDEAYCIAMKKTIDVFLIDIILHPEQTGDQSGAVFAQHIRRWRSIFLLPLSLSRPCMIPRCVCFIQCSVTPLSKSPLIWKRQRRLL